MGRPGAGHPGALTPGGPGGPAPRRVRVVVAPDSFKGSLAAPDVAAHLGAGVRSALAAAGLRGEVVEVPLADGGEGTLDAVARSRPGAQVRTGEVVDALGRPHRARRVVVPAAAAGAGPVVGVAELAEACGLPGVADVVPPRPLDAGTLGLGQVLRALLDDGVGEILVALGGSASTDGGAGLLVGLGARVRDAAGRPVGPGGRGLAAAASLELDGLDPRARAVRWSVACDVRNPLVGPEGAAAVFGPQKGATPRDVRTLDAALDRWADLLAEATGHDVRGTPGAGAAGGTAAALLAVLGAQLLPGSRLVADLAGLDQALAGADLVLTGEGALDGSSLQGKVVGAVLDAAARAPGRPPVAVVAGRVDLDEGAAARAGVVATGALDDGARPLAETFSRTPELLEARAAALTREVLGRGPDRLLRGQATAG